MMAANVMITVTKYLFVYRRLMFQEIKLFVKSSIGHSGVSQRILQIQFPVCRVKSTFFYPKAGPVTRNGGAQQPVRTAPFVVNARRSNRN